MEARVRPGWPAPEPSLHVRMLSQMTPSLWAGGLGQPGGTRLLETLSQAAGAVPAGTCWPSRPRAQVPAPESQPRPCPGPGVALGYFWVLVPLCCLQGKGTDVSGKRPQQPWQGPWEHSGPQGPTTQRDSRPVGCSGLRNSSVGIGRGDPFCRAGRPHRPCAVCWALSGWHLAGGAERL